MEKPKEGLFWDARVRLANIVLWMLSLEIVSGLNLQPSGYTAWREWHLEENRKKNGLD